MKIIINTLLVLGAGASVAACEKTVSSVAPQGAAAYDAIAVAPERSVPQVYTLRSGDRVNVAVFREEEFSAKNALIDTSGNISLPMLGTVRAAGMTQDELAALVSERLAASYLRDPRVSVMVETPALQTISVEGEVEQPGVYETMAGHTLLTAIAQARSTSDRAKVDEVIIFRTVDGARMAGRFDLAEIRAGVADDPQVLPGDVIVVGYSQLRAGFQDVLRAAPLFNVFTRY